jgi:hypothetical protein
LLSFLSLVLKYVQQHLGVRRLRKITPVPRATLQLSNHPALLFPSVGLSSVHIPWASFNLVTLELDPKVDKDGTNDSIQDDRLYCGDEAIGRYVGCVIVSNLNDQQANLSTCDHSHSK